MGRNLEQRPVVHTTDNNNPQTEREQERRGEGGSYPNESMVGDFVMRSIQRKEVVDTYPS